MIPSSVSAVDSAAPTDNQPSLRPSKPTTPKPAKPDYFPLSRVRQALGPATYPGIAAAEDAANGLVVSDALHDVTFYTEVSNTLPDAGRPVLNSVLFSQRHIVNDTPSIEEEIAAINERMRLWRATRLQQLATEREYTQQQSTLDEKVESRVREREMAERERTLRRISRMIDFLIPEVEKALAATADATPETLGVKRREYLMKQWKEREESRERLIRDMRLTERRCLVERQYQRNVDERNSLVSQHYFSYMELLIDERRAYRQLKEKFYNEKILVGVIDDETKMRCRLEKNEENSRLDIIEQVGKLIPLTVTQLLGESGVDTERTSKEILIGNKAETSTPEIKTAEPAEHEEKAETIEHEESAETIEHGEPAETPEHEETAESAEHEEKAETIVYEEPAEIIEHEEAGESAEHEEAGESAEHEETAESAEHEEKAETIVYEEPAETIEHEEAGESAEHEEAAESAEHEETAESAEHEEKAETIVYEENAESAEHEENAESAEHEEPAESAEHEEKAETAACEETPEATDSTGEM